MGVGAGLLGSPTGRLAGRGAGRLVGASAAGMRRKTPMTETAGYVKAPRKIRSRAKTRRPVFVSNRQSRLVPCNKLGEELMPLG